MFYDKNLIKNNLRNYSNLYIEGKLSTFGLVSRYFYP